VPQIIIVLQLYQWTLEHVIVAHFLCTPPAPPPWPLPLPSPAPTRAIYSSSGWRDIFVCGGGLVALKR
jgi:hypothetical protein